MSKFAEIMFNKIIGRKTKIYINLSVLNTGNFIHYKSKVIGGIRWCSVNTISYKLHPIEIKFKSEYGKCLERRN